MQTDAWVPVECKTCGLEISYRPSTNSREIDHFKYDTTCQRAKDRAAFDKTCPDLQKSIENFEPSGKSK